jgi:hypothetical protein
MASNGELFGLGVSCWCKVQLGWPLPGSSLLAKVQQRRMRSR